MRTRPSSMRTGKRTAVSRSGSASAMRRSGSSSRTSAARSNKLDALVSSMVRVDRSITVIPPVRSSRRSSRGEGTTRVAARERNVKSDASRSALRGSAEPFWRRRPLAGVAESVALLIRYVAVDLLFGGEMELQDRVHPVQDPAKLARHFCGKRLADVRARRLELIDKLREFGMVAAKDRSDGRRTWRVWQPRVQPALLMMRVRQELMGDRVDRVIQPPIQLVHAHVTDRIGDLPRVLEVTPDRLVFGPQRVHVSV